MAKTLKIYADITENHELQVTLPADVPIGPAEIVLVVTSEAEASGHTLGDLLNSEFFGMWKDRTDINDSTSFAKRLRDEAWRRSA